MEARGKYWSNTVRSILGRQKARPDPDPVTPIL
jgi:hypothetical protein